jgi:hypothetical protein
MCRPLIPLTALAPAQVWSRSYVHGSGAMSLQHPVSLCHPLVTLRRPPVSLLRPLVTLRHPPVSLRRPPVKLRHPSVSLCHPWSLRRSPTVTAESKPVVVV